MASYEIDRHTPHCCLIQPPKVHALVNLALNLHILYITGISLYTFSKCYEKLIRLPLNNWQTLIQDDIRSKEILLECTPQWRCTTPRVLGLHKICIFSLHDLFSSLYNFFVNFSGELFTILGNSERNKCKTFVLLQNL